ncbi:MAG: hypothetical protein CTY16_13820 [Methylobacter sp.]|nr:MAG: hypothetical protein CTY16_13820 [Methylobacter sp.]
MKKLNFKTTNGRRVPLTDLLGLKIPRFARTAPKRPVLPLDLARTLTTESAQNTGLPKATTQPTYRKTENTHTTRTIGQKNQK